MWNVIATKRVPAKGAVPYVNTEVLISQHETKEAALAEHARLMREVPPYKLTGDAEIYHRPTRELLAIAEADKSAVWPAVLHYSVLHDSVPIRANSLAA